MINPNDPGSLLLPRRPLPRRQSGAALLLMMLVILVAATAILVSRLDRDRLATRHTADTQAVLARAKQALIDYAVTYVDRSPGGGLTLPCPDIDATGPTLGGESHTTNCGATGVTVLGRFPWKTLETPAYADSSGECLWYAVSGTYKNAGSSTDAMINPDTNGQLQLYALESGAIVEGAAAEDRAVAILFAALEPVSGQVRAGSGGSGSECSSNFSVAEFLEGDGNSGISNAVVSGNPMAIEQFIVAPGANDSLNDHALTIRRTELAAAVYHRPDFAAAMDAMTRAIAACIASWGSGNSAVGDLRLPWPAPVALGDYRIDANYDDRGDGVLSGRLPNVVDDSRIATTNTVDEVLADCDTASVPEWDSTKWRLWQNWKDHFFYAVADAFQPGAAVPTSCGSCLTVNGTGAWAAIVIFSNERLRSLGQVRNAPPVDPDTRNQINNYLEGRNAGNHPYTGGNADFETRAPDDTFNDIAYCIDAAMNVSSC
jgi:hypothetical protein